MQRTRRLALLTYHAAPDLTPDDQLLLPALTKAGFDAFPVVWTDVQPASIDADLAVIRSTWDYFLEPDLFVAWLSHFEATGKHLFNHSSTIRWNMNKDYLFRLQAEGVDIPRTALLKEWQPSALIPFLGSPIVTKPVISAGAFNTHRFLEWSPGSVEDQLRPLLDRGPLLIQEYMPEIESDGEWSFIFLGRGFSHSVCKIAAPSDFRVQEEHGGTMLLRTPEPDILNQVNAILARLPDELLYARVDGIIRAGRFLLMELELFEPSLYLSFESRASESFAVALTRMTENHGHRR